MVLTDITADANLPVGSNVVASYSITLGIKDKQNSYTAELVEMAMVFKGLPNGLQNHQIMNTYSFAGVKDLRHGMLECGETRWGNMSFFFWEGRQHLIESRGHPT